VDCQAYYLPLVTSLEEPHTFVDLERGEEAAKLDIAQEARFLCNGLVDVRARGVHVAAEYSA